MTAQIEMTCWNFPTFFQGSHQTLDSRDSFPLSPSTLQSAFYPDLSVRQSDQITNRRQALQWTSPLGYNSMLLPLVISKQFFVTSYSNPISRNFAHYIQVSCKDSLFHPTVQYGAETRTHARFLARIAPPRDRPLPPARATFSTQSRFYLSARYCTVCNWGLRFHII